MEIIRDTPGRIYARSNTNGRVKFLIFISCLLMIVVVGICLFVLFTPAPLAGFHLHSSGDFYYSLNNDTARLELFLNNNATTYEIPESVVHSGTEYKITELSAKSFTNKKNLQKIIMPKYLSEVAGDAANQTGAFAGCVKLQEIVWGSEIRYVGQYAFKNCLALTQLAIPQSMQFIDANAFMNCIGLVELKINSFNGMVSLKPSCFTNCVNVTKLSLGERVGTTWGADTKQALADLVGLTEFEAKDNANYSVVGDCLLSRDEQTLVLGGKGATIPDTVTKIDDWAFGKRYAQRDIYITDQVTTMGKNTFAYGVIYTNASAKPAGWQTELTVRCGAKPVTFYNDDTESVLAYTYLENSKTIYPNYADLFGDTDDAQVFLAWNDQGDTCQAQYVNKAALAQKLQDLDYLNQADSEDYDAESLAAFQVNYQKAKDVYANTKATQTQIDAAVNALEEPTRLLPNFDKLDAALQFAGLMYEDADERAKHTLTAWEDFKSAYARGKEVGKNNKATAAEIRNAVSDLMTQCAKLFADENQITGNVDWQIRMNELMSAIKLLDAGDFKQGTAWRNLQDATDNIVVADKDAYLKLRAKYEALVLEKEVDLTKLNALRAECAGLIASDYTPETWQVFAVDFANAQQITDYNMSVSQARQRLLKSKNALEPTANNVAKLKNLVAQCEKMQKDDYQNEAAWELLQNALSAAQAEKTNVDWGERLRALQVVLADLQAKPVDLTTLQVWISVCEDLESANYGEVSYATLSLNLASAKAVNTASTISQVDTALFSLQSAFDNLTPVGDGTGRGNRLSSVGAMPYFIVAAILFTLVIIILAVVYSLKKSQRSKIRE